MKKILYLTITAIVLVGILALLPNKAPQPKNTETPTALFPASPLDATYTMGDEGDEFFLNIELKNGLSVINDPNFDAGVTYTTKVFGKPVMGDLDGDGDSDAIVLLQQDPGGTGTFYYLGAAINTGNGYKGTNTLFIGDRIAPQSNEIWSGIAIANYADRGPTEPFSARPTIGKSLYAQLVKDKLARIEVAGEGVHLAYGFVTYGGEVRTFTPCGAGSGEWWLMGDAPAYKDIIDGVKKFNETAAKPYTPVFAVLVGKAVDAPKDGFGADYKNGFYATKLVKFVPGGACN